MARLFLMMMALLTALALTACGPAHHARGVLKDSARDFNMMLRWKKWHPASSYVEVSQRGKWLDSRMQGDANLRMMGVKMIAVRSTGEDTADVQVAVSFTRAPQITVQRTVFVQKWKKIKEVWMLIEESPVTVDEAPPVPSWP